MFEQTNENVVQGKYEGYKPGVLHSKSIVVVKPAGKIFKLVHITY